MAAHTQESHELDDRSESANGTFLTRAEREDAGQQGDFSHAPISTSISTSTPSSTPTTADRSTTFLDGLRGLAAFCVFVQHYIGSFDWNLHEHGFGESGFYYMASLPFVRVFYNGGSAAVSIFFVLSGYVLSKSPVRMLRNGQRQKCGYALASAVVRRPFRLYLPCFVITFIIACMMWLPFDIMPEMPWCKLQESLLAQLWHWLYETVRFFNPFQHHGSDHYWYPYNLVIWTIPVELKGSMLIYAVTAMYGFSGISQTWALGLLAAAVVVLLQLGSWDASCFLAGLILTIVDLHALDVTHLARWFTPRQQVLFTHALLIVGWYLLTQPAVAGQPQYSLNTPGWHYLSQMVPAVYNAGQYYRFWQSYGAMLVVYCTLRLNWLQHFLNSRPMRYLGKVSFMFYLIHLPFLYSLGDRLGRVFGHTPPGAPDKWWDNLLWLPDWGPVGFNPRFLVLVVVLGSIILVLSDIATRTIDMPSVRIGKKVAQRLGLEANPAARKEAAYGNGILPEHTIHSGAGS